jgi:hypothetical protein
VTSTADLEHSLSGNYVRGVLRRGREAWALFAVPEYEPSGDPARCLTFALLWLDRLRHGDSRKNITGVRVLLPAKAARAVRSPAPVSSRSHF